MDMVEPQQRDILSQRAAMIANSPHRQLPEGEENLIKRQIKILVQILERTAMDMSELENRLCTVLVAPPPDNQRAFPPDMEKEEEKRSEDIKCELEATLDNLIEMSRNNMFKIECISRRVRL